MFALLVLLLVPFAPQAPAIASSHSMVAGIAVDGRGNVYTPDMLNDRIVRLAPDGARAIVAGRTDTGFRGDGGPATQALLSLKKTAPAGGLMTGGVAMDGAGNLYITDTGNARIRKVTVDGVIRTLAGNGTHGFKGDGESAMTAQLNHPAAVAVDARGNVYIADRLNYRIRLVTPDGIIRTVAGTGVPGDSGDKSVPAISAAIGPPTAIVVDASGNVYFTDPKNARIRRLGTDGMMSTAAGTGTPGFGQDGPANASVLSSELDALAVDKQGTLYFTDAHRVRKLNADRTIQTLAGNAKTSFSGDGGPASAAGLASPKGLAVDSAGNIYVGDAAGNRIRKIDSRGTIHTFAQIMAIEQPGPVIGIRGR